MYSHGRTSTSTHLSASSHLVSQGLCTQSIIFHIIARIQSLCSAVAGIRKGFQL